MLYPFGHVFLFLLVFISFCFRLFRWIITFACFTVCVVTASTTDLKKRFLLSGVFLPYTPSYWFQALCGSRQFNLKVSRASCWSLKHSPDLAIRLSYSNPQKKYGGRFYLRLMAGRLRNEESASYGIWTLFACQKSHALYI